MLWLLLGLVFGALFLAFARAQGQAEVRTLAAGLVVAAIIYVGFAFAQASVSWVLFEIAGVAFYGALAWLGIRHSVLWLAAGWALHTLWDTWLHLFGGGASFAPEWYVVACISFDLLVAVYVACRLRPGLSQADAP